LTTCSKTKARQKRWLLPLCWCSFRLYNSDSFYTFQII